MTKRELQTELERLRAENQQLRSMLADAISKTPPQYVVQPPPTIPDYPFNPDPFLPTYPPPLMPMIPHYQLPWLEFTICQVGLGGATYQ